MLKRQYAVLAIVLVALIISVSAYGVYNVLYSVSPAPSPSPSSTSTPTSAPTLSPTVTPTASPSSSPLPTPASTPTPSASPTMQPTVSASPTLSPSPSPTVAPTPTPTPTPTSVTVTDYTGANVTVPYPVNSIVCLGGSYAEIICALGAEDKIVATLGSVPFPSSLNDKLSLGSSSSAIPGSLEVIFSLNPDLVLSDAGFVSSFNTTFSQITNAGIPLYLDATGLPDRMNTIVSTLGVILGNSSMAEQINNNTQYYTNLVQQRIQNIPDSEQTTYYYEWGHAWFSVAGASQANTFIVSCGGVNIVMNNSVSFPTLSPEFVAEANPDVIIQQVPVIGNNMTVYQNARDELMSRPALKDTTAVKEGRVYIYNPYLRSGLEYPIGKLYFAKWLYPDLFADINPETVFTQLIQQYFGVTPEGVYFYPQ